MAMSPALQEFSRSWRVALVAMVGLGLGYGGLPVYCFGVFVAPLARESGWTIATVGNWMSCASLAFSLSVPFVGRLTDRWGARKICLTFVPLFAAAVAVVSVTGNHLWAFYATGVAVGSIGAGTTAIVYGRAIGGAFEVARGTALGLMTAGVGIASTFAPYFLQVVVDRHGWRIGFVVMALMAASVFPLVLAWVPGNRTKATPGTTAETGLTRAEAMRRPVFWLIASAYATACLANGGVLVYLVPYLIASGLSGTEAAAHAGLLGVASIAGRLAGGFVIDRLHVAWVCAALLILQASASLALGLGDVAQARLLILTIGFALGAESDGVIYSVTRYFGLRSFSELWGTFGIFGGACAALGAAGFGYLLGDTANYRGAFVVCAALLVLAATFFVLVARRPFPGLREHGG